SSSEMASSSGGLPPMTPTEEKLRGMGVTMDQRKRLMMASKFGLGPLTGMGMGTSPAPFSSDRGARSRSPPAGSMKALPPPSGTSSSSYGQADMAAGGKYAIEPGGHQVPAVSAEQARRRQAEQTARAQAIRTGGVAGTVMSRASQKSKEDDSDLDAFLAGGKKIAQAAAKAKADRGKRLEIHEADPANHETAAQAARLAAEEFQRAREAEEAAQLSAKHAREERQRREEEEQKQEERRRKKEEEKRRRKEEKEKQRAEEGGADEDSESAEASDSAERKQSATGREGGFKQVMKGDESKRMHWGESVKGRVSTDYKGMTDAELEKRFGAVNSNHGEKLMTEQEVLKMLRKGRK
ncbi:unnamed protein product, partial [Polarella glacialis]